MITCSVPMRFRGCLLEVVSESTPLSAHPNTNTFAFTIYQGAGCRYGAVNQSMSTFSSSWRWPRTVGECSACHLHHLQAGHESMQIEPVELVMNIDPIMMDTKTWESRPSRLENRSELVNRTLQSEQFSTAPEKCHKEATAARHNRGPKNGGASQTSSHDNLKTMLVKWLELTWKHVCLDAC